jgi:hypothetical protein
VAGVGVRHFRGAHPGACAGSAQTGSSAPQRTHGPAVQVFAVEQDDGHIAWCDPASVESVEAHDRTDSTAVLKALSDALARPLLIPRDGLNFAVVVGDHEKVHVKVTLEQVSCQPGSTPPPADGE